MILFDTNVLSYVSRNASPLLQSKVERELMLGTPMAMSVIVLAEIKYGIALARNPLPHRENLASILRWLSVLDWSRDAAETYARIRSDLKRAGTTIGPIDTLIAAHALAIDATLVTNNEREFSRVPGLKVENWIK